VILNGANIGGQLACDGGYFEKGLIAQHLKTGEDVLLRGGFKSNGEVVLNGAEIGGQLVCAGGHFGEGLTAQNLKAGEDVFLNEGFKANGVVNLLGANIGGQFSCADGYFEDGLTADGLRYQYIDLGGDWKKGLAWLQKMRGGEFQHYEQLMMTYNRMGRPDWAREIGFELEEKKHEQSKGLWRAWYSIRKWTMGYGYKPFRYLWWAIGLPLFGTVLFSGSAQNLSSKFTSCGCVPAFLANEWIPSEGEALKHWKEHGQAPQGYPEFHPLIYSLDATFFMLPLGQLGKWRPDNTLFLWVRWILTFVGGILLTIVGYVLGINREIVGVFLHAPPRPVGEVLPDDILS